MAKTPPASIVHFVDRIRFALGRLQQNLVPPPIAALDFVAGMWSFQIVYSLCELGIPDQLSEAPVAAAAIASKISAPEDKVYRLLRAASNIGIVTEMPGGAFRASALCKTLRSDSLGSARDFILFQGRIGWQNWAILKDCIRTGRSAIDILHGKTGFDYFTSPEAAETFNRAMTGISSMATDALLTAYPFERFKSIADVGGGHGRLVGTILKQHPAMRGVLMDLETVVSGAPAVLRELGVVERCLVLPADFFEPLPIVDADLYLMKSVIHDWLDDDAIRILNNVRAAMRPDARLLLYETVVPGANQPGFAKFLDLEMIVHANGKERTEQEYDRLLKNAGFRLLRVIPTAGPMSVVEATPAAG